MALSCDPNSLAALARCFKCLPPATLREVQTYLLCQIANGGSGAGVQQIVAGTNVTVSPAGGTGVVTVNSSGGGGSGGLSQRTLLYAATGTQTQSTGAPLNYFLDANGVGTATLQPSQVRVGTCLFFRGAGGLVVNGSFTVTVSINGTVLFNNGGIPVTSLGGDNLDIYGQITFRAIGAGGSVVVNGEILIVNHVNTPLVIAAPVAVDTTVPMVFQLTAVCNNAQRTLIQDTATLEWCF